MTYKEFIAQDALGLLTRRDKLLLAKNSMTESKILRELEKTPVLMLSNVFRLRYKLLLLGYIASNVNTPQVTLRKLMNNDNWAVRSHVAKNSKTSTNMLKKLANDSHSDVRLSVIMNQNTATETLKKLRKDKDPQVVRHVKRTLRARNHGS